MGSMTAKEVICAKPNRDFFVISVHTHSHSGCVKLGVSKRVYQLLRRFVGEKTGADLVFMPQGKSTNIQDELEKLGDEFGKKFSLTPPLYYRKQLMLDQKAPSPQVLHINTSPLSMSLHVRHTHCRSHRMLTKMPVPPKKPHLGM